MTVIVTALVWLVLAGGLIPAIVFFAQHRPTRPWRTQAKLVTALIAVPSLLYVRSVLVLALHHGVPKIEGWPDAIVSIGLGALCDALFIWLIVLLRRYRASWADEEMRDVDPR